MWLSGRAVALQAIGRRFESDHLHQIKNKQSNANKITLSILTKEYKAVMKLKNK